MTREDSNRKLETAPARWQARPRQAVILAGGRGERMQALTAGAPKHLYRFHGRPFASYLVERLAGQGFERILFLTGYRAADTENYFRDGRAWGIEIACQATPESWESARRLEAARARLDPVFLLCYCDNEWPLRLLRQWEAWRAAGTLAQVTVYDNSDGYSRSNVRLGEGGRVERYDWTRQEQGLDGVEIGFALMDRRALDYLDGAADTGVARALYPRLAAAGELSAYVTGHRYYSAGSPERLKATAAFLAGRRAVLVDRDGVLNRRAPAGEYVRSWEEWEWMDGAREALEMFHRAGYAIAVVSNQAGIGRGVVERQAVERIHARMSQEAPVDAVYYCPHDWEAGCRCRKPRPGLLWQAQRDFHLDLSRTWFAGDDRRDAEAAEAAGCLFAEVSERTPLIGFARTWLGGGDDAATAPVRAAGQGDQITCEY